MKISNCVILLSAVGAVSCKPRKESNFGLRDAYLSKLRSRASCVVYQKDDTIFTAKCPKQSDTVAVTTKPENITDEQWAILKSSKSLTRLQCPGGDANELAKMNAKKYEKQLSENLC